MKLAKVHVQWQTMMLVVLNLHVLWLVTDFNYMKVLRHNIKVSHCHHINIQKIFHKNMQLRFLSISIPNFTYVSAEVHYLSLSNVKLNVELS